jgi:Cytidine and deoxycytidylate deaminase zinc-binding region
MGAQYAVVPFFMSPWNGASWSSGAPLRSEKNTGSKTYPSQFWATFNPGGGFVTVKLELASQDEAFETRGEAARSSEDEGLDSSGTSCTIRTRLDQARVLLSENVPEFCCQRVLMTPEKFMARAIELGRAGLRTKDARPFAAIVVRQGKMVGEGSQQKTLLDPTAHGEIDAIRDACRRLGTTDLSGCELYTTREPHIRARSVSSSTRSRDTKSGHSL